MKIDSNPKSEEDKQAIDTIISQLNGLGMNIEPYTSSYGENLYSMKGVFKIHTFKHNSEQILKIFKEYEIFPIWTESNLTSLTISYYFMDFGSLRSAIAALSTELGLVTKNSVDSSDQTYIRHGSHYMQVLNFSNVKKNINAETLHLIYNNIKDGLGVDDDEVRGMGDTKALFESFEDDIQLLKAGGIEVQSNKYTGFIINNLLRFSISMNLIPKSLHKAFTGNEIPYLTIRYFNNSRIFFFRESDFERWSKEALEPIGIDTSFSLVYLTSQPNSNSSGSVLKVGTCTLEESLIPEDETEISSMADRLRKIIGIGSKDEEDGIVSQAIITEEVCSFSEWEKRLIGNRK